MSAAHHLSVQFEHKVHPAPAEAGPDYDDDPNNWTARMHPTGAFAKNALRPIYSEKDDKVLYGRGGYP